MYYDMMYFFRQLYKYIHFYLYLFIGTSVGRVPWRRHLAALELPGLLRTLARIAAPLPLIILNTEPDLSYAATHGGPGLVWWATGYNLP